VLTDAHCHPANLAPLFPAAEDERRRLGVGCVSSSTTLEEFEFCEGLAHDAKADSTAPVLPGFAVHPQMPLYGRCGEDALSADLAVLDMLADGGRLAVVGETGFDLFNADFRETEKAQDRLFAAHLDAALRHGLPLVLHVRRAMHKVFAHASALKKCRSVVFHSWSGTEGDGEALLRRGINAFFSFGTVIALNHRQAMRCCATFPADRLLTETDAPYQPLRGKGFSGHGDLPRILEAMAALRREAGNSGMSAGELEGIVEGNFRTAFCTSIEIT